MRPNFLIVGATKSGTTSLANSLRSHPAIFIPKIKEVDFFDVNWEQGLAWYERHFNRASAPSIGEATPNYMASRVACERIKQILPRAKLIFLLRNPITRAHSHYWFRRRLGGEEREFSQALLDEAQLLEKGLEETPIYWHQTYLIRPGYYARHLKTYLEHFPPEQMLVVLFDDLVSQAQETLKQVQNFLRVPAVVLPVHKDNPSPVPRNMAYHTILSRTVYGQSLLKEIAIKLTTKELRKVLAIKLFGINLKEAPKPQLKEEEYELLFRTFEREIIDLARLLNRSLQHWLDRGSV